MPNAPHDGLHPHSILGASAAALAALLEAFDLATSLDKDVWEFAVEIATLRVLGLTDNHMRWLLTRQLVAQAHENKRRAGKRRSFRKVASLSLSDASCFVLTEAGAAYARGESESAAGAAADGAVKPCWDEDQRELRVGTIVVKVFKQPSFNQELILKTFEDDGWPARIDDPLPGLQEQDGKQRLHNTINHLNRGHKAKVLRFHGGGDGQSVCWRLLGERHQSGPTAAPERTQSGTSGPRFLD